MEFEVKWLTMEILCSCLLSSCSSFTFSSPVTKLSMNFLNSNKVPFVKQMVVSKLCIFNNWMYYHSVSKNLMKRSLILSCMNSSTFAVLNKLECFRESIIKEPYLDTSLHRLRVQLFIGSFRVARESVQQNCISKFNGFNSRPTQLQY